MHKYMFLSKTITQKRIFPQYFSPLVKILVIKCLLWRKTSNIKHVRLDIQPSEKQIYGRLETLEKEVPHKHSLFIVPKPMAPSWHLIKASYWHQRGNLFSVSYKPLSVCQKKSSSLQIFCSRGSWMDFFFYLFLSFWWTCSPWKPHGLLH